MLQKWRRGRNNQAIAHGDHAGGGDAAGYADTIGIPPVTGSPHLDSGGIGIDGALPADRHPETLEAVIEHAEARKRRFAERAARAEADRDNIIAQGGSPEVAQAAEARRAAAITAVVALMGQLKVLRRVLEEFHEWHDEELGASAQPAVPVPSAVDALSGGPGSRENASGIRSRGRRNQDNPRSRQHGSNLEGRAFDRHGGRLAAALDDDDDHGDADDGDDDDDDDDVVDDDDDGLSAELENEELEEALVRERSKAEHARAELAEAEILARENIADHQDQVHRLRAVLDQPLHPEYEELL
jgi:hypothetical protein